MANAKNIPSIKVKIDRMVDSDRTSVKAIASANIGGAFSVHGIRVVDSEKGPFVQMPQTSFEKDGKRKYSDIFHPVTSEAHNELYEKVLEAYNQELSESQDAGLEDVGPTM